jgi:hypothetical protein
MKKYLVGFFYSLPIQLLLLHFRRYQVLLIFWYILFSTVSGHFLETFGANSLFLAPEYLANVNALSMAIVGFALGVFIMSWNITTFILHTKHIRFLATTAQPFLKYCINNAVLPLLFLFFYLYNSIQYDINLELLNGIDIGLLIAGFFGGLILSLFITFAYFFSADKNIFRNIGHVILSANRKYERSIKRKQLPREKGEVRVDWFFSARFGLRRPRNVKHYSQEFLDTIFKRHHFAAVLAVLLAFIFLMGIGFFSDNKIFQVPAAASITVFFAILIGVSGAISLFLGNWSIPVVVLLYVLVNGLYQQNIIDPRNKAYGLDYTNIKERPGYNASTLNQMVSPENIEADRKAFLNMLQNWKNRQQDSLPVLFVINTSGGGIRSATFTLNVLQKLDSITNGSLMPHTFLIAGASGGMLGAAYFRELYLQKQKNKSINLQDRSYPKNISRDLLNPLFSSLVSRDIAGPARTFETNGFTYIRDRGYAFEQKLSANTKGAFRQNIGDYKHPEEQGIIPLMFFNSTITRDAREMIISTHPARFLMRPLIDSTHITPTEPDALDFVSFFNKQQPLKLNVLTALRMNATFPYVLPNVWLPSRPVIDVMDAGLRDNFGQTVSLRFLNNFKGWLQQNTSKVVLIQIHDRQLGDWERPYEPNSILSVLTRPFLLLQNNWYRLQDFHQSDQFNYFAQAFGFKFYKVSFQYIPYKPDESAALSLHLTASEKVDLEASLNNEANTRSFKLVTDLMK